MRLERGTHLKAFVSQVEGAGIFPKRNCSGGFMFLEITLHHGEWTEGQDRSWARQGLLAQAQLPETDRKEQSPGAAPGG